MQVSAQRELRELIQRIENLQQQQRESVNRVTLLGNTGRDPEIRRTQDGRPIANLRIATTDTWRDKASGEKRERTEWHTVVVLNEGLTKIVERYVKKGMRVLVEGQLQTRKWQDKDGQDRYSTEVVLSGGDSKLILLSGMDTQDDKPAPRRGDDDQIPF